jgi:hypothetical protein
MTTILADKSSSFTPKKVDYSIPNQPATVHDLLLQKSNGSSELVVWGEQTKGANSIAVNLGHECPVADIYDPTVGTTAVRTLRNVSTVPLTLNDHPLIIELR